MADSSNINNDTNKAVNPLSRFNVDESEYIPDRFSKSFKRSIYFPEGKGEVLYQATQIAEEIGNLGVNEIVAEALELWVKDNRYAYIKKQHNKMLSMSEDEKSRATDVLWAIEKEMGHLNEGNERFKAFFDRVLDSMVDFGLKEMDQAVAKAVDFETIETFNAPEPDEKADEKHESVEDGKRVITSSKRSDKNGQELR